MRNEEVNLSPIEGERKKTHKKINLSPFIRFILGILVSILTLGVGLNAFAFLGFGGDNWKEEVLLHDGSKLIVERTVKRGGRHEVGQKPPYKEQTLSFVMPGTELQVTWEDKFSEDVGSANFLPMLLDVHNDIAYLVVSPMGCLSYNKWGRPNPPYVVFQYVGKTWQRIPLVELPTEIKMPNLIFSAPDIAVERSGTRFMTAEMIKAIVSGYKQPEYQTILREPLDSKKMDCGEMIYDGNGGWVGIGWFRNQQSFEACLKVCERNRMSSPYCPCEGLFLNKISKEK